MSFDLVSYDIHSLISNEENSIVGTNSYSVKYGLALTKKDAAEIILTHNKSLNINGRVEFESGIIEKIIFNFCDSPFIFQDNYKESIETIIELFYIYKNETLDLVSDDELISYMKNAFNSSCQGSFELLGGRELHKLSLEVRKSGKTVQEYSEEGDFDE